MELKGSLVKNTLNDEKASYRTGQSSCYRNDAAAPLCPKCGHVVSKGANDCPYCKRRGRSGPVLAATAFILVLIVVIFSIKASSNHTKTIDMKLCNRMEQIDGYSGDIGKIIPEYGKLDIDKDGKPDSILRAQQGNSAIYQFVMGNGSRLDIDVVEDCSKEATFFYFNYRSNGIYEILTVKLTQGAQGVEVGDIDFGRQSGGDWACYGVTPPYINVEYNQGSNTITVSSSTLMFEEIIPYSGSANDARQAMDINSGYRSNAAVCDAVLDGGDIVFLYNVGGAVFTPVGIKVTPMDELVCSDAGTAVAVRYWPEACE